MANSDSELSLSRRKILAALGTVGAAGGGAGLGTSAFIADKEAVANNSLTAGELDLKAAYSAHYSNGQPSEDGVSEGEGVDEVVQFSGSGSTGEAGNLPSGLTGLPTTDAWLVAVSDPDRFLENTQYADSGEAVCPGGTDAGDIEQPVIDLTDVKPGDFGEATIEFALCDNPGFVWLRGGLVEAAENGRTEPERGAEAEEDGVVELLDAARAAAWVDDGDNYQDGGEETTVTGSLREVLQSLSSGDGVSLAGDIAAEEGGGTGRNCFSANNTHAVAFAWWVPRDVGNAVQGDSVRFELSLYAEQCRHNSAQGVSSDPGPDALEFEPTATQPSPGRVELTAGDQQGGTTAATDVPTTELVSDSGIALRSVSVDLGSTTTMNVTVEQDATPDEEEEVPDGFDPFGFFSIEHPQPRDEDIEGVRFGISIERERIDAPTLFTVLRYDESRDEWVPLPTELTGKTTAQYHYQVSSPGLSEFAPAIVTGGAGDSPFDGGEVLLPEEDPRSNAEIVFSAVGSVTTPTEAPPDSVPSFYFRDNEPDYPLTVEDAFEIVNEGERAGYYEAKTTAEHVTVSTGGPRSNAVRGDTRRLEPGERASADITVEPIEPENQLWVTLNLPTYINGRETDKGPILGGEGENAGPPSSADEECLNKKRASILVHEDAYVPSLTSQDPPTWLPPSANASKAHYQIPGILSVRNVGNISEDLKITITQSRGDFDADLIDVNLRGSGEDFRGSEVIAVSGDTLREEGTVRKEIGLNFESNVPVCTQVLGDDSPDGILGSGGITSPFAYEYVGNIELEVEFDENDSEWQERTGENSHTSSVEYYTPGKSMAQGAREFAKNAVELWAELTKAVIFPGGPLKMYRAFRAVTLGTSSLGRTAPLVGLWDGLSEISNFFDTPPITPSGLIQNEILDEKNYDFVFGGASDTFEELDQGVDVVEYGFKEPIVGVGVYGPSLYFAARGKTQITIDSFQTRSAGDAGVGVLIGSISGDGSLLFTLNGCEGVAVATRRLGFPEAALLIKFDANMTPDRSGSDFEPVPFVRVLQDDEVVYTNSISDGTFVDAVGVSGEVEVELGIVPPVPCPTPPPFVLFSIDNLRIEAVSPSEFV